MPELPEVERMRSDIHACCVGKRITKVVAQEDTIVFNGVTSDEFVKALVGRVVVDTKRYGKNMWLVLDSAPHPMLHCGMTGNIRIKSSKPLQFMDFSTDDQWPPRFEKFTMEMEDGAELAFADARRLGRIRLVHDPMTELPISRLGFDPIHSMPSIQEFKDRIAKKRVPVKARLLDQAFAAGVGNWVADEVLHLSKIHPNEYTQDLTPQQLEAMYQQITHVCNTAVDAAAESDKFPEDWIFHHRWNKRKGTVHPKTGHKIEFLTVGGRTSAFLPQVQKLNNVNASPHPAKKSAKAKKSSKSTSRQSSRETTSGTSESEDAQPARKKTRK
jgi:formamidopyrimidine-DNA glycosylase